MAILNEFNEGRLIPGSNLEVGTMLDRTISRSVIVDIKPDGSRTEKYSWGEIHEINPEGLVVRRGNIRINPSALTPPLNGGGTIGPDYERVIREDIANTVAKSRKETGE